ncbi:UNVERIFIED_CONTAM: Butyrate--CoA ligase AAE11, peroxisomal [Sesamum radiatum]|uniref:Butyrate--CoA ligase AAE11, peroxisomal n=1 Tax=Sesamum radiatum TaxID=300843 RepID=A0AAW2VSZ1_SESRA
MEIKDRSKDVIISGGENISSVEVEAALYKHPSVVEAAVVAMPHPKWGESPCAFVTMRNDDAVEEAEIIQHCRRNLPHYMVPKKVAFMEELPKTSTGKVQKFQLRAIAKTFENSSENESCLAKKSSSTTPQSSWEMPRDYQYQNQEQILALSRL